MASQNQFQPDRDWSFDIDLTGVPAPTGQTDIEIPDGFYEVKINDVYVNKERNANRVIFRFEIAKGPYAGVSKTDGLGMPQGKDDKVRYYWRARAESAGYTAEQLDQGSVSMKPSRFIGKTAFIRYTAPKEDGEYANYIWLAPNEWERQRALVEGSTENVGSNAGGGTGGAKDPMDGPTTVSRADLLERLKQGANA